jgi:phosphate transport system substrate-binding protein
MAWASVMNRSGRFISPSIASFQAAAATADWAHAKDFDLVMTDAPGPNAYPITATTFALMYKHPKDAPRTATTLKFFRWTLDNGRADAAKLDYVSLPPALAKRIEAYWAAEIK